MDFSGFYAMFYIMFSSKVKLKNKRNYVEINVFDVNGLLGWTEFKL